MSGVPIFEGKAQATLITCSGLMRRQGKTRTVAVASQRGARCAGWSIVQQMVVALA